MNWNLKKKNLNKKKNKITQSLVTVSIWRIHFSLGLILAFTGNQTIQQSFYFTISTVRIFFISYFTWLQFRVIIPSWRVFEIIYSWRTRSWLILSFLSNLTVFFTFLSLINQHLLMLSFSLLFSQHL